MICFIKIANNIKEIFCELALVMPHVLRKNKFIFLQTTLERHLAQFHLDPLGVGVVFMLYGSAYALLNPFWGWLADRVAPRLILLLGSLLLALGFSLVGPLPFLGLEPAYGLTVAAVIIGGVGLGAQLVAAFSEAHK
jgi:MFS family permease